MNDVNRWLVSSGIAALSVFYAVDGKAQHDWQGGTYYMGAPTASMNMYPNATGNQVTSRTWIVDKRMSPRNVQWGVINGNGTSWDGYMMVLAALAYPDSSTANPPTSVYDATLTGELGITGLHRFRGTAQNGLPRGFYGMRGNECFVAYAGTQGLGDLTVDLTAGSNTVPPAAVVNWLNGQPNANPPIPSMGWPYNAATANSTDVATRNGYSYPWGIDVYSAVGGRNTMPSPATPPASVTYQGGTFDPLNSLFQTNQGFRDFLNGCVANGRNLRTTGHSMGGFMAQVTAMAYNAILTTQNKTGDGYAYLYNSAPVFQYSRIDPTLLRRMRFDAQHMRIWGRPLDPLSMLAANNGNPIMTGDNTVTVANPIHFVGLQLDWGPLSLQDVELRIGQCATEGPGSNYFKHTQSYANMGGFPNVYCGAPAWRKQIEDGDHRHTWTGVRVGLIGALTGQAATVRSLGDVLVPFHTKTNDANVNMNDWLWHYLTVADESFVGGYSTSMFQAVARNHGLDNLILMKWGYWRSVEQTPRLPAPWMWGAWAADCYQRVYMTSVFASSPAGVGSNPKCKYVYPPAPED